MIYRMKQNAASLSLICIMSTGVLLLISSTTSLYVGQEHSLYMHYPKEFRISLSLGTEPDDSAQFEKELKEIFFILKQHKKYLNVLMNLIIVSLKENQRDHLSLKDQIVSTLLFLNKEGLL